MFQMYNRLRAKSSPQGWTLDDCIQIGVDDPGEAGVVLPVGCVVGDADSYEVGATVRLIGC